MQIRNELPRWLDGHAAVWFENENFFLLFFFFSIFSFFPLFILCLVFPTDFFLVCH